MRWKGANIGFPNNPYDDKLNPSLINSKIPNCKIYASVFYTCLATYDASKESLHLLALLDYTFQVFPSWEVHNNCYFIFSISIFLDSQIVYAPSYTLPSCNYYSSSQFSLDFFYRFYLAFRKLLVVIFCFLG